MWKGQRGVSILINKKWKGSTKKMGIHWWKDFKIGYECMGYILTIIGIYAPNEDNGATVKDEFFANLNEGIVKSSNGIWMEEQEEKPEA